MGTTSGISDVCRSIKSVDGVVDKEIRVDTSPLSDLSSGDGVLDRLDGRLSEVASSSSWTAASS